METLPQGVRCSPPAGTGHLQVLRLEKLLPACGGRLGPRLHPLVCWQLNRGPGLGDFTHTP